MTLTLITDDAAIRVLKTNLSKIHEKDSAVALLSPTPLPAKTNTDNLSVQGVQGQPAASAAPTQQTESAGTVQTNPARHDITPTPTGGAAATAEPDESGDESTPEQTPQKTAGRKNSQGSGFFIVLLLLWVVLAAGVGWLAKLFHRKLAELTALLQEVYNAVAGIYAQLQTLQAKLEQLPAFPPAAEPAPAQMGSASEGAAAPIARTPQNKGFQRPQVLTTLRPASDGEHLENVPTPRHHEPVEPVPPPAAPPPAIISPPLSPLEQLAAAFVEWCHESSPVSLHSAQDFNRFLSGKLPAAEVREFFLDNNRSESQPAIFHEDRGHSSDAVPCWGIILHGEHYMLPQPNSQDRFREQRNVFVNQAGVTPRTVRWAAPACVRFDAGERGFVLVEQGRLE